MIDKRDLLIVKLQSKLDTISRHAIESVEGLNVSGMTNSQRALVNCLAAHKLIDLDNGIVRKHILTYEELMGGN